MEWGRMKIETPTLSDIIEKIATTMYSASSIIQQRNQLHTCDNLLDILQSVLKDGADELAYYEMMNELEQNYKGYLIFSSDSDEDMKRVEWINNNLDENTYHIFIYMGRYSLISDVFIYDLISCENKLAYKLKWGGEE